MKQKGVAPDLQTYRNAIRACKREKQWVMAVKLLEELERNGLRPDNGIFNDAITACSRSSNFQMAWQLAEKMNGTTYCAMIASCKSSRRWKVALGLLREMKDKGIKFDVYVYSWQFRCVAVHLNSTKRWSCFNEMEQLGIKQGVVTYSSFIAACAKVGDWKLAIDLLHDMSVWGVEANIITYNTAINA